MLHSIEFCLCVCVQQGRHIAHKFESGREVGVIKAFDKKDPHADKFSVKYTLYLLSSLLPSALSLDNREPVGCGDL
jgi:hypothetical protein